MNARTLLAGFDRMVAVLAGALLVVLLGIVTLGIVTRAIGRPFSWTDEMSGYLMVWVSCLGWILATRHHAHIRIRYFQDKLPEAGRRATEVAIQLALLGAGLVLGTESILLVERNLDIEAVSIPVSTAWLYAPLIPAGFVMAAQALADLTGRTRRRPATPDAAS
jgi:TRAP-type C4-dicarboxylate transport system permease small subunit